MPRDAPVTTATFPSSGFTLLMNVLVSVIVTIRLLLEFPDRAMNAGLANAGIQAERDGDCRSHLLLGASAVDLPDQAAPPVPAGELLRLGAVHLEAMGNRPDLFVASSLQRPTAPVARHGAQWRLGHQVVGSAAPGADNTGRKPPDHLVRRYLEEEGGIQPPAEPHQHRL